MREDERALPSAWTLERYRLRELPAAELERLDARVARDPALREALERLDAFDREILSAHPPETFLPRLRARAEARARQERAFAEVAPKRAPRAAAWRPALAGFAALALVALPTWIATRGGGSEVDGHGETSEETVRIKGLEPRLAIFRKTAQGAEPLLPGEKAHAGEVLRIGYQAAGFPFGAIVSVDGNGNITRHWPADGARAARLEKGEALLPEAFELDAAPDYERFYFVVARESFPLESVLAALRAGDTTPPVGNARVVRFDILKDQNL